MTIAEKDRPPVAGGDVAGVFPLVLAVIAVRISFDQVEFAHVGQSRAVVGRSIDDLDARAVRRTDLFKMITGGDCVMAERKFAHPFTFVPFATMVFSANEPPATLDQSKAWFDRWIVLPFDVCIEEHDQDEHLVEKLTQPAELEGVLVEAVQGLRRVLARGGFELPPSVQAAGERYRQATDTVTRFVVDACRIAPEAHLRQSALYRAYRDWATENGVSPLPAVTFHDRLRRDAGHRFREAKIRGHRHWWGVSLLSEGGA